MQSFKFFILTTFVAPIFLMANSASVEVGSRQTTVQESGEVETYGYGYDRYPPIYYSNAHHWLNAITLLDNNEYTLELEDGSQWKVSSYDGSKALNWKTNDPLAITQNSRWFSRHEYRIINKANGASVEATLFLGPILHGEYSRFIVFVDHNRGEVWLNDDTRWDVSFLDASIFRDWAEEDHIILGINSNTSFFSPGNDTLLINVNLNNAIRAKQY